MAGALLAVVALFLLLSVRTSAAPAQPDLQFPWAKGLAMWFTSGPHNGVYSIDSPVPDVSTRSGLDFGRGAEHWAVLSAAAGTIVKAGCDLPGWEGYGCVVEIDHGDGFQTLYGHFYRDPTKDTGIRVGDVVPAGKVIGHAGDTGHAFGIHLHFELRQGGHYDGDSWVSGWGLSWDGRQIDGWTIHASRLNYEGTMTRPGEDTRIAGSQCFWTEGSTCERNDVSSGNAVTASVQVVAGDAAAVVGHDSGFRVYSDGDPGAKLTLVTDRGSVVRSVAIDGSGAPDAAEGRNATLVAWWDRATRSARALLLDDAGNTLKEFRLPGDAPPKGPLKVAGDPKTGRYFVTWESRNGGGDVYGVLVQADGRVSGSVHVAAGPGRQGQPDAAYDGKTNSFVVAWTDFRFGAIWAAAIASDGSVSATTALSEPGFPASHPAIAAGNDGLVAVWQQSAGDVNIVGRFLGLVGGRRGVRAVSVVGDTWFITNARRDQVSPDVAWEPLTQQFVATWVEDGTRAGDADFAWRMINTDGAPKGPIVHVDDASRKPSDATIACDHATCLIVGEAGRSIVGTILLVGSSDQ